MPVTMKSKETGEAKAPSWLKKGKDAKQRLEQAETEAQLAREQSNKLWPFRLKEGEEKIVTFLDGDVDEDGDLVGGGISALHTVRVGANRWETLICCQEAGEYCPMCADGDRPSVVVFLSLIDHTQYTVQKGQNTGQVRKDQKRLYLAKTQARAYLQKIAAKRNGLRGVTIEISRSNDKAPNCGDVFSVEGKMTEEELVKTYGEELTMPPNYENELTYRSPEELQQMGIGKPFSGVGGETGPSEVDTKQLEQQL